MNTGLSKDVLGLIIAQIPDYVTLGRVACANKWCHKLVQQRLSLVKSTDGVGQLVEGKKHGLWRWWYLNGQLKFGIMYKAGVRHGLYRWWASTGQLYRECVYKEGKPHGLWKHWITPDQLTEAVFEYGVLVTCF